MEDNFHKHISLVDGCITGHRERFLVVDVIKELNSHERKAQFTHTGLIQRNAATLNCSHSRHNELFTYP